MVDNICSRWQALQEIQSGGQLQLWDENYDNQFVDDENIEKKTIEHFSQCDNWILLHEALAVFFMKHGPICSIRTVKNILKRLEKEGRISVLRNPDVTAKGKPTAFMSEEKLYL